MGCGERPPSRGARARTASHKGMAGLNGCATRGAPEGVISVSIVRSRIWRGSYHDSVALMRMSAAASSLPGIREVAVVMGTAQNRHYLEEAGMWTPELAEAAADDLIAVIDATEEGAAEQALGTIAELLVAKSPSVGPAAPARRPRTYRQAVQTLPEANLALISVPGVYAAAEALQALKRGLNVMIFSDHVPVEQEVELKVYAATRGLLVMGPDCGTALIGGRPLAFANRVRRGSIGVIGASGTGIQQVTTLIDRLGAGVSHAIGVGSRDLSEAVGGLSMLQAIDLLLADEDTEVLVLLSKPCAPAVVERILGRVQGARVPVVINFLGTAPALLAADGVTTAATLEEAAVQAVRLALHQDVQPPKPATQDAERAQAFHPASGQRYIRGLYAGGTLAYEAMCILAPELGPVHANIPLNNAWRLPDSHRSLGHTVVDFGEDEFTSGRPHPMLDSRLRVERIRQEAQDPETAVVLLDITLGFGAQPDPAGSLASAIAEARRTAAEAARELAVVAAVVGTAADPQELAAQEATLRAAGAIVCPSGAAAARLALRLVQPVGTLTAAADVHVPIPEQPSAASPQKGGR